MNLDLEALPSNLLYAPEEDMWPRFESDETATIGATHLVSAHGQFMFFAPRPVGTTVARERSLGVMETAKTAIAIHAAAQYRAWLVPRLDRFEPPADDEDRSNFGRFY